VLAPFDIAGLAVRVMTAVFTTGVDSDSSRRSMHRTSSLNSKKIASIIKARPSFSSLFLSTFFNYLLISFLMYSDRIIVLWLRLTHNVAYQVANLLVPNNRRFRFKVCMSYCISYANPILYGPFAIE